MKFSERVKSWSLPALGSFAILVSLGSLTLLIAHVLLQGWSGIDFSFFASFPSRFPEKAGIFSALMGSLWLIAFTALFSIPLGLATAVYLEEFARRNRFTHFVRLNISNLAAVPSIVYGLLGLAVFVRFFSLGRSVISGALTLSLLILPVIVIAGMEALKSVPKSIRQAGYGVGATKTQVVFGQVLPQAIPGMITGIILSLSRAIGETAPLIVVGALSYAAFVPEHAMDQFTSLSIQIFNWAGRPQPEFHELAASAIIVLLGVTLSLNAIAIFFRLKVLNGRRS